jgi:hypothetical protein
MKNRLGIIGLLAATTVYGQSGTTTCGRQYYEQFLGMSKVEEQYAIKGKAMLDTHDFGAGLETIIVWSDSVVSPCNVFIPKEGETMYTKHNGVLLRVGEEEVFRHEWTDDLLDKMFYTNRPAVKLDTVNKDGARHEYLLWFDDGHKEQRLVPYGRR